MRNLKRLSLLALITLFYFQSNAQNKKFIEGKLSNGLHYIIKENSLPAKKVEYRLVYKLGSLCETKRERGMAHFLEHMAFGGTTHFPQRAAVEYLESLGITYGFDINAYTGYDRTIYMFAAPADAPNSIDNSLLILHDWITAITLNPQDVEEEKEIIKAEINDFQESDPFYEMKIGVGKHVDGIPIGTIENVERITPSGLSGFYNKWYSPQNATLVVVGDIDASSIEKKIITLFGKIKNKSEAKPTPTYNLKYRNGITFKQQTDTIFSKSKVELIIPTTYINSSSVDNIVKREKRKIFIDIIGDRIAHTNLGRVSEAWYLAQTSHFCYEIQGKNKKELIKGVENFINVLHYLKQEADIQNELDSRCKAAIASVAKKYKNQETQSSSNWCNILTDYVLVEDQFDLTEKEVLEICSELEQFGAEELVTYSEQLLKQLENSILVAYTDNGMHDTFSKHDIKEIISNQHTNYSKFCSNYVYKYRNEGITANRIEEPLFLNTDKYIFDANCILGKKYYKGLDVTDIVLKNGIRLILKPTSGQDEKIYINTISKGGVNHIPDSIFKKIDGMAGYIDMCGIDGEDNEKLLDYMLDREMALSLTFESQFHGFTGMAKQDELSNLLLLMKEKVTRPEICEKDFNLIKKQLLADVGNSNVLTAMMERQPDYEKDRTLDYITLGYLNREGAESREELEGLDYSRMLEYYKLIYGDTSNLTVIISGKMNLETTIKNAVKVLSSFNEMKPKVMELYGITPALDKSQTQGYNTHLDKNPISFNFIYEEKYDGSFKTSLTLKLMRQLIRNRLIKKLREEEGLVYSPGISLHLRNLNYPSFCMNISASTQRINTPKVTRSILEIIKDLQSNLVDEKELNSIKKTFLINKRESLNPYDSMAWRDAMSDLIKLDHKIEDFENYEEIIHAITPTIIQSTFRSHIKQSDYILLHTGKFETE